MPPSLLPRFAGALISYSYSDKALVDMRATLDGILRVLTIVCACGVLYGYFQPWVMGPGGGVPPARLRETMEGPHKFLSLFNKDNHVSRNYALAPYLIAVPIGAGLAGATTLLPGPTHWVGIAASIVCVASAKYLRSEVKEMPFHKEGLGAAHTEKLGYILFALSVLRRWTRPRRRGR
jgi:hypothetical protein